MQRYVRHHDNRLCRLQQPEHADRFPLSRGDFRLLPSDHWRWVDSGHDPAGEERWCYGCMGVGAVARACYWASHWRLPVPSERMALGILVDCYHCKYGYPSPIAQAKVPGRHNRDLIVHLSPRILPSCLARTQSKETSKGDRQPGAEIQISLPIHP